MTTTLPASHRTSKPGHPGRAARRGVSPLAMRTTRVSMQIRLEAAIMASMVTQRYTTNTVRSLSLPSVAQYHARLSGSAWLDRPGHNTYLVPAGGFRLAQRPIRGADELAQGTPGMIQDRYSDGNGQPKDEARMTAVFDGDRLAGDVIPHPLTNPAGLGHAGLRQQDGELFTVRPPRKPRAPEDVGKDPGNVPQHLVPSPVPGGFMDAVEVINMDHDQGEWRPAAYGADELDLCLAPPGLRVEEPGLGIDAGLGDQLRLHQVPSVEHYRRQRQSHEHRVDGYHERERDGEGQLDEVGGDRLAVAEQLADPCPRVGELDGAKKQAVIDDPRQGPAARRESSPGNRVNARSRDRPGKGRRDPVKGHGGPSVSEADSGIAEHAPVDEYAPYPPQPIGRQRDRGKECICRRQGNRYREVPHRLKVPADRTLDFAHCPGRFDGHQAAPEQRQVGGHVLRGPCGLRHSGRGDDHGHDHDRDDVHARLGSQRPYLPRADARDSLTDHGSKRTADVQGNHRAPWAWTGPSWQGTISRPRACIVTVTSSPVKAGQPSSYTPTQFNRARQEMLMRNEWQ